MLFDQELNREFQRINDKHVPDKWLLLRSITLWPKPKHNATFCILVHVVFYTIHGHPSLMTIRYSEFLHRFYCKMYLWHKRQSMMGISSICSVAAATRGAGVSIRAGVVWGNCKLSKNLAWSE
jgi:hypothetical protein